MECLGQNTTQNVMFSKLASNKKAVSNIQSNTSSQLKYQGFSQWGSGGISLIILEIGLTPPNLPPQFCPQTVDFVISMQFLAILPNMSLPTSRTLLGNPGYID